MATELGGGTLYIQDGSGWTGIGRTERATFEDATPPELAGLDDELPFARMGSLSMTVTFPLTRAHLRNLHAAHGDIKRWSRCRLCNPRGNPRPLPINGHEYHRRQMARKRRRRGR